LTSLGRGRHDFGDGLTEARDPEGLLGLPHAFQQGKTLSLELRNGNFFHSDPFDYDIISWSELMVITARRDGGGTEKV
jgi:hypothetical protein